MTCRSAVRRMTSIARALDAVGANDLSDKIDSILMRSSQISGSDFATTDPDSVQGMEPTLRGKPVRPFIGDGFGEDDEDDDQQPNLVEKKRRPRSGGFEVGRQVALYHRPDSNPKKDEQGA